MVSVTDRPSPQWRFRCDHLACDRAVRCLHRSRWFRPKEATEQHDRRALAEEVMTPERAQLAQVPEARDRPNGSGASADPRTSRLHPDRGTCRGNATGTCRGRRDQCQADPCGEAAKASECRESAYEWAEAVRATSSGGSRPAVLREGDSGCVREVGTYCLQEGPGCKLDEEGCRMDGDTVQEMETARHGAQRAEVRAKGAADGEAGSASDRAEQIGCVPAG